MAVAVAAVAVAEVAGEPLRSARESGKFDAECSEGMANLDWWWGCLLLLSLGLNYHHLNSNDRQIFLFYRFFSDLLLRLLCKHGSGNLGDQL